MTKAEITFLIMAGIFLWAVYETYREAMEAIARQPIIATSGETEEEKKK